MVWIAISWYQEARYQKQTDIQEGMWWVAALGWTPESGIQSLTYCCLIFSHSMHHHFSTLPSSMSSAGIPWNVGIPLGICRNGRNVPFLWIPMDSQWNSREFPWKFQNDSYGFPVEFEWNSCGFLVEFQGNSMEIPLKFQNDSKWNLNGSPTTSYRISLNVKSGLFKKLGKSMCINQ